MIEGQECCKTGKWIRRQMDLQNIKTGGRMILCICCGTVFHRWNEGDDAPE